MGRKAGITPEAARVIYTSMGDSRSLRALHEHLQGQNIVVSIQTIQVWSRKYEWVEAAARYDNEHVVRQEKVTLDELEDMELRHATLGIQMQTMGREALELIQATLAAQVGPREAVKLAETGVRMERLARGVTEESRVIISYNIIVAPIIDLFERIISPLDPAVRRALSAQFAEGVDSAGERLLPESTEEKSDMEMDGEYREI